MIDDAEEFMEKIWDEHTDVAEEINQKINATHIIEALNSLDDKYKNILILRYFEDREYGEISDILQIPGGSVATLLHRAKKQLSKKLQHINN